MKLIKILGLAAVAAVAAMAFVGAGTAGAARLHPLIGLCTEETAKLLLCPEGKRITAAGLELGLLLGTQIGKGVLEGTLNEECAKSMATAKTGTMEDQPEPSQESKLNGEITELTFSECEPCKKITTSPPYQGNILMTEEPENDSGKWFLEGKGSAKFSECPFGVTCKFGSEKLTPRPIIEMNGTESILNTNKTELTLEEGSEFICGKTGRWNSRYGLKWKLYKDKAHTELLGEDPIWLSLLPTGEDV